MSRKTRGTQTTGGVKETMEKTQEASQPFATEEQAEPRRSHQYCSNNDPSLYLYGNPPSTLEPYSMAEWNNPNNTQNQYQYGNPVSITGSNVHHASPYYSSNPSPFARGKTLCLNALMIQFADVSQLVRILGNQRLKQRLKPPRPWVRRKKYSTRLNTSLSDMFWMMRLFDMVKVGVESNGKTEQWYGES